MPTTATLVDRHAATAAGLAYLVAIVPAMFAEFYVPSQLVVAGNAAATIHQIALHEPLYRLGIAANFLTVAVDVVLVASLYLALAPINRQIALVAAMFRLIETTILAAVPLADMATLHAAMSGSPLAVELRAFHGEAYAAALLLFGFGSPLFCYLWLESRYVPRAVAMFGIAASLLVGICELVAIATTISIPLVIYAAPIAIFEAVFGLWLVIVGATARPRPTPAPL